MRQSTAALLLGVPLLFIMAFFAVPFFVVALESLHISDSNWGLENYVRLFSNGFYAETLWFTFKMSLWVTAASFLIGYPLAYYITRIVSNGWVRRLLYVVVITPLFTSNIVRSFGWMILLGRGGLVNETLVGIGLTDHPLQLLNNEFSIIIGMTYIMVPFMVLTIAAVLQSIDRSLEYAALDLGATKFLTFSKITFPLSLPGVVAGSLIVFTLSVSAYVTPSVLSGGKKMVMSMLIFQQYGTIFDFRFGATLAVALLITTLVLIGLNTVLINFRPQRQDHGVIV